MSDIEIGRAKRARRAYTFDDIAIVPSRRTRDPQDVSVSWTIDAFTFDTPVLAAPMDSVVSPATAIAIGRLGGLGVLDLEGVWTRYDDPEPVLAEIRSLPNDQATERMQQIYAEPIKAELIRDRLAEIRAENAVWAASSEGGLFDYGSDAEVVANLTRLAGAQVVVGSVTRADEFMRVMQRDSTMPLVMRGHAVFAKLAAQAGWKVERVIERIVSDQVAMTRG